MTKFLDTYCGPCDMVIRSQVPYETREKLLKHMRGRQHCNSLRRSRRFRSRLGRSGRRLIRWPLNYSLLDESDWENQMESEWHLTACFGIKMCKQSHNINDTSILGKRYKTMLGIQIIIISEGPVLLYYTSLYNIMYCILFYCIVLSCLLSCISHRYRDLCRRWTFPGWLWISCSELN